MPRRQLSNDTELSRAARHLMQSHGSRAAAVAEQRAARLDECGEDLAADTWRQIGEFVRAIEAGVNPCAGKKRFLIVEEPLHLSADDEAVRDRAAAAHAEAVQRVRNRVIETPEVHAPTVELPALHAPAIHAAPVPHLSASQARSDGTPTGDKMIHGVAHVGARHAAARPLPLGVCDATPAALGGPSPIADILSDPRQNARRLNQPMSWMSSQTGS